MYWRRAERYALTPPHLCSPSARRALCQTRASRPVIPPRRGDESLGVCLASPDVWDAERDSLPLASSRAPRPGLQDSGAGRGLEKGRSVLRGPVMGLDPVLGAAHSTENPACDRLRTLARGIRPTGPWAPQCSAAQPSHPTDINPAASPPCQL